MLILINIFLLDPVNITSSVVEVFLSCLCLNMATAVQWRQSPVNCFFDQFWHQSAPTGMWAFMWRQRGRFLSLWMLTSPLSLVWCAELTWYYCSHWTACDSQNRDWLSPTDIGVSKVTAAEVKDSTIKAVGGQYLMFTSDFIWFQPFVHCLTNIRDTFIINSIRHNIGELTCLATPNPV